ncbi:MAG TPA: hypothetical protein DCY72_00990 [Ruminococcaceae bacterium]|nr:hypothetical protein [Oscillospiraceae bacterium]
MSGYLYTAIWFLLAAYLIYVTLTRYRKPMMFVLSGFMVFLGVWELVNTLTPIDLKSGVYGWIYRGVALVVLVLCLIWYFVMRNRDDDNEK